MVQDVEWRKLHIEHEQLFLWVNVYIVDALYWGIIFYTIVAIATISIIYICNTYFNIRIILLINIVLKARDKNELLATLLKWRATCAAESCLYLRSLQRHVIPNFKIRLTAIWMNSSGQTINWKRRRRLKMYSYINSN